MKRRIFFLVTLVTLLLALTACDEDSLFACRHTSYGAWETTVVPTCLTEGSAVRRCTTCSQTETKVLPALGHSYGDYETVVPPTCLAEGTERRRCIHAGCNASESRAVASLGHAYGEWRIEAPSTCVTAGSEVRTCVHNGCDSKETRKAALAAHSYGDWVLEKAATCSHTGLATASCTVEGCRDKKEKELPTLAHVLSDYVTDADATCERAGSMHRSCTRDNCTAGENGGVYTETVEIPKKPHTYGGFSVTTPPTCIAEGEETRICSVCFAEDKKPVGKTAHTYGVWQNTTPATCIAEGEDTRYCTVIGCDESETRTVLMTAHTYSESWTAAVLAGCETVGEERAYCTVPGCLAYDRRETAAIGHRYLTYLPDHNATCLADGTETARCEGCDGTDTRVIENSKLPHDYEWVIDTPATCLADGEKHKACQNTGCTEVIEENTVILRLPHDMTEVPAVAATCDTPGNITYYSCASCELAYDTLSGDHAIADFVLSPLGHAKGAWVSVTPATCLSDGKEIRTCTRAGCVSGTEYRTVPTAGHRFITYLSDHNATCLSDGTKTAICENCPETDVKTDVNSKKPHDLYWVTDYEATATAPGEKHKACRSCDHTEGWHTPIPTGTHTHSLYAVPATPASCVAAGILPHYHCAGCGMDYQTEAGLDGELMTSVVDPIKPHSFKDYISNGDATCLSDGTKTAICENCPETDILPDVGSQKAHAYEWVTDMPATCVATGVCHEACMTVGCTARQSENTPIAKLSHSMQFTPEVKATCVQPGNVAYYTCAQCEKDYALPTGGTALATVVLPATGKHSFVSYIPNHDETCLADGTETATCRDCPATDTRTAVGTKRAHSMTATPRVEPACGVPGNVAYYTCAACRLIYDTADGKNQLTDTALPALTHDFGAEFVKIPVTCEGEGEKGHTCKREGCGFYERTAGIDPIGHEWNAGVQTKDPTCAEDGEITYTCKREGCGETDIELIDAYGHSYGTYQDNNDAACEKNGTESAVCESCGETDTREKPGTLLGHRWYWVEDRAPTEDEYGIQHEECRSCDARRNENTQIPKLSHSHSLSFVEAVSPTCQAAGNIAYYACHACGNYYLDATGETAVVNVVLPKDPEHHNFDTRFTMDRQATIYTTGEKSRHCLNTGCTERTQIIILPKLNPAKPPEWTAKI